MASRSTEAAPVEVEEEERIEEEEDDEMSCCTGHVGGGLTGSF